MLVKMVLLINKRQMTFPTRVGGVNSRAFKVYRGYGIWDTVLASLKKSGAQIFSQANKDKLWSKAHELALTGANKAGEMAVQKINDGLENLGKKDSKALINKLVEQATGTVAKSIPATVKASPLTAQSQKMLEALVVSGNNLSTRDRKRLRGKGVGKRMTGRGLKYVFA